MYDDVVHTEGPNVTEVLSRDGRVVVRDGLNHGFETVVPSATISKLFGQFRRHFIGNGVGCVQKQGTATATCSGALRGDSEALKSNPA